MKYLHTMVRVTNLETSLKFYRDALGLKVLRTKESEQGRVTLVLGLVLLSALVHYKG